MGLFSKLFGKSDKEMEDALSKLKNMFEEAGISTDKPQTKPEPEANSQPETAEEAVTAAAQVAAEALGPSGDSWGPVMPAEENQYNYNGSYAAYFSRIFQNDFPEYQVKEEPNPWDSKRIAYTFTQGARTRLIVEVLSDSSAAKKLRRDCEAQGIPYLRFYYDHEGWWNTRSYVNRRVREALGG